MKKFSCCCYTEEIDNYAYSYLEDDYESSFYSQSIRYTYTSASINESANYDESCFYLNAKLFA
ncbi:MAG: hypothetical protein IJ828_11875 [Treponema sp.]|nr:hypothetical protein [Treponema sp.]